MSDVKRISKELPDDVKFSSVAGIGEQALWGTSADTAVWFARRGPFVVAVVLGGELKAPQALREQMRGLVMDALAKLP